MAGEFGVCDLMKHLGQRQQAGEGLAVAAVVHAQGRHGALGPVDADHLAAAEHAVIARGT